MDRNTMTYTDLTLEILSGLTLENLESLPIDDTPEPNGVTFYNFSLDDLYLTSVEMCESLAMGGPTTTPWHCTFYDTNWTNGEGVITQTVCCAGLWIHTN